MDDYGNRDPDAVRRQSQADTDAILESEAREWIEEVLGEALTEFDLAEALKSGVVLCNLVNKVQPGSVAKIASSSMPFKQMENIGAYLDACRKYGVPAQDTFLTVDLFEGKNMNAVVRNLHSLGRVAQQQGFSGPTLGARLATTNRRSFTAEQMAQAKATPSRWTNRGGHEGAAASGSDVNTGRREVAGPGKDAVHSSPKPAPRAEELP